MIEDRASRQEKRIERLQERYKRLEVAYDALKDEKAALENELAVCKAKLDRTGKYEAELKVLMAEARETGDMYARACKEFAKMREAYRNEVNTLIDAIKG